MKGNERKFAKLHPVQHPPTRVGSYRLPTPTGTFPKFNIAQGKLRHAHPSLPRLPCSDLSTVAHSAQKPRNHSTSRLPALFAVAIATQAAAVASYCERLLRSSKKAGRQQQRARPGLRHHAGGANGVYAAECAGSVRDLQRGTAVDPQCGV